MCGKYMALPCFDLHRIGAVIVEESPLALENVVFALLIWKLTRTYNFIVDVATSVEDYYRF
jgi:hypothetical protein